MEASTSHQAEQGASGAVFRGKHFTITLKTQRNQRRFNTTQSTYNITFNNSLKGLRFLDIEKELKSVFETIISILSKNLQPTDLIKFYLYHSALIQKADGWVFALRPISEVDAELVMTKLLNLLQSREDISVDETLMLNVTTVAFPRGSGRIGVYNRKALQRKKAIAVVDNWPELNEDEQMCFGRSVVIALAKLQGDKHFRLLTKHKMNDPYPKRVRHSFNNTWERAKILYRKVSHPFDKPVSFEEIKKFEKLLNMQIIVIAAYGRMNGKARCILYPGYVHRTKKIYLFWEEPNHYHAVLKMESIYPGHRYCEECGKFLTRRLFRYHFCKATCTCCFTKDCADNDLEISWRTCLLCYRDFKNEFCFNEHKKRSPIYNSTMKKGSIKRGVKAITLCSKLIKCKLCGAQQDLTNRNIKIYPHKCYEYWCRSCLAFKNSEHLCYIRAIKQREPKAKYIAFDLESYQDSEGLQKPFLAVAQKTCQTCIEKTIKAMPVCTSCGIRERVFFGDNAMSSLFDYICAVEHTGYTCYSHFGSGYDSILFLREAHRNGMMGHTIFQGSRLIALRFKYGLNIAFFDSSKHLPMALAKFGKALDLQDVLADTNKGDFPYQFPTADNLDYKGVIPELKYFDLENRTPEVKARIVQWHKRWAESHEPWSLYDQSVAYCKQDCSILLAGILKYRSIVLKATCDSIERDLVTGSTIYKGGVDPLQYPTLASCAQTIYLTKHYTETYNVSVSYPLPHLEESVITVIDPSRQEVRHTANIPDIVREYMLKEIQKYKMRVKLEPKVEDGKMYTKGYLRNGQFMIYLGCNKYVESRYLNIIKKTFLKAPLPKVGPKANPSQGYSRISLVWLQSIRLELQATYKTQAREVLIDGLSPDGEHIIKDTTLPRGRLKVDGYCSINNTVYQFFGCIFHGCPVCYEEGQNNPLLGLKNRHIYAYTMHKIQLLKNIGYKTIYIFEHEFNADMKTDPELMTIYKSFEDIDRLTGREAFHGAICDLSALHADTEEERYNINYKDIVSLYPQILANYPLFIGAKSILKNPYLSTDIFRYRGLIKAKVLAPAYLEYGVLPIKYKGKLIFPLCYACLINASKTLCRCTPEKRQFIGCWSSIELQYAVAQKNYIVINVIEVYNFEDVALPNVNDIAIGPRGLFGTYIETFLKGKLENSPIPDSYRGSTEDYVSAIQAREGITLNIDRLRAPNPALRAVMKLYLNSLWGKFSYNADRTEIAFFDEPSLFFEKLYEKDSLVQDVHIIHSDNDTTLRPIIGVEYRKRHNQYVEGKNANVYTALQVTAYGRLTLLHYMDMLSPGSLLYVDTDSLIYKFPSDEGDPLPEGCFLGDLTSEIPSGVKIKEFVATAPKSYSILFSDGTSQTKIKGFGLGTCRAMQDMTFEKMRMIIAGEIKEIAIRNKTNFKVNKFQQTIRVSDNTKLFSMDYNKKLLNTTTLRAYPFGIMTYPS